MKLITFSFLVLLSYTPIYSQEIIELYNPSFENPRMYTLTQPYCCMGARGWASCGEQDLNTPDAQPGHFGVTLKPNEGEYYLGIVTRDDGSWESISQKLSYPIVLGQEYYFSIALAKAKDLFSHSRVTKKQVNYNKSIKLRVWGGNSYCEDIQLLGETEAISNFDWMFYEFIFKPSDDYSHITIEAYFDNNADSPYCGNILLDNLSPIISLNSETDSIISELRKERIPSKSVE